MSELPHMPLYWAEFFADTQHMSDDAAKAYLFLIGHAWIRGAKLPNDEAVLARLARCGPKMWRSVRGDVLALWNLGEDGFWRQKRMVEEFERARKRVETLRENGRNGGRPRSGVTPPTDGGRGVDAAPSAKPNDRSSSQGKTKTEKIEISGSPSEREKRNDFKESTEPDGYPDANQKAKQSESDIKEREYGDIQYSTQAARRPTGPLPISEEKLRAALIGALPDGCTWSVKLDLDLGPIRKAMADGADLDRHVVPTIRAESASAAAGGRKIWRWKAFEPMILAAVAKSAEAAKDAGKIDFGGGVRWPADGVRDQVRQWRERPQSWPREALGPEPGANGCRVPPEILLAEGVKPYAPAIVDDGLTPQERHWAAMMRSHVADRWREAWGERPGHPQCAIPVEFQDRWTGLARGRAA